MTTDQTTTLVLKDQAGDYYLVPQELLERGRVPQEQTAEVERLIAEQPDVQGYGGPLVFLTVCVAIADAAMIGIGLGGADKLVEPAALVKPYLNRK